MYQYVVIVSLAWWQLSWTCKACFGNCFSNRDARLYNFLACSVQHCEMCYSDVHLYSCLVWAVGQ
jgi:hypothetical protein